MPSVLDLGYEVAELFARNEPERERVRVLRKWIETQALIPKTLTDGQLVPFMVACGMDDGATKTCLVEYFSARKNGPELFDGRDVSRADLQFQLKTLEFVVLPHDTEDGCRIVVHRLQDGTPGNYHMVPAMKLLFMTIDAALFKGPPNGLIILFDMREVRLTHLTRVKLGALRKFFHYVQEGLPMRLSKIHVMNVVWFMDKCMAIMKPFMRKELMNKLHLHPPNMDMTEFYKKEIPKKCLPADFGGDLPPLEQLHQQQITQLANLLPYYLAEEAQRGVAASPIDPEVEENGHFGSLAID